MSIENKLKYIDLHIASLKSKGETLNQRLIRKWERKRRALEAQL